ncbi:integrin alpha-D-like isoform X3 [Lemur catta]|uniref:integrin alpha-D-like isoform X3 n=1 Tax=Lemur catta TaxID=9447 RepID=UPI001E26CBD4|nr:integrin alpha-D-like isoform X3 [Lemur catta]
MLSTLSAAAQASASPATCCSAMAFGMVLLLAVLASCHGFNLDVEEPTVFREDADSFGQSVVQFGGSRLVVGAPLEVVAANQTGRLYDCASSTGMCQPVPLHIPPEAVNISLGLSLAASTNHSWLLACGPTMHRACGENMYAKGSCLLLGSHLQIIRTVPAALPECPVPEMDIVFLIDGSGSIDQSEFLQMKAFVRAVMGWFKGTNSSFSLLQYSNLLKIHFTFAEFHRSSSPQSLVDPIVQLKGLTYTATGILKVVTELFHSKNGARESAKKILIVITDGQKYKDPLEYSAVIPQAEKAGIIRYAIGVRPPLHCCPRLSLRLTQAKGWWAPPPQRPLCCRWATLSRSLLPGRSSTPLVQCLRRTTCSRWTTLQHLAASRRSCRIRSLQWRVNRVARLGLRVKGVLTQLSPTVLIWCIPFHNSSKIALQNPSPRPWSPPSALSPHGLIVSGNLSDLFPTGTQSRTSSSFQHEMSQEGFSSVLTMDGPVLGAVGSFSWAGGAFLYPPNMNPTFINMSQENVNMTDSYLGYSSELALWKGVQSLVLGAPRHQHTGKVVIFTQESGQWRPKAEVAGAQIGSYFGASLCSVDVDGDGGTDLVLIGAPHYYEQTRGGQVSVCPLPQGPSRWQCEVILRGQQGHPWGRFGAALTVLGDVNGDKLTDVAIGAPGEQEKRGAVYLFHGAPGLGISSSHSQRIAGSQLSPRLQYFGQSLSGGQDLTQDGLVDLAVGAQGHVLLLRSLPVLTVDVTMRFTPGEVAKAVYRCWEDVPTTLEAGEATVCLTVHKSSLDQLGDVQSSVRYDLALDPGRLISRAIFDETKNWTLTRRITLGLGDHCETMKLLLPDCVEDMMSPIILRLNFSLVGEPIPSLRNLRPVLAVDTQDLFTASLPFEKNCGQDGLCEGDLSVDLSFSGLKTLMVGSSPELNVTVTVWNEGEDSYGTVINFYYPAGLSFRRVSASQQPHQRPLRLACEAVPSRNEGLRSSRCSINHPIFQEGSKGTFIVTFDVSHKANLGDRMLMRANASSENNKPATSKTNFQLELPVKYSVYTVISRQEESTKYFNFSTSDVKSTKEAEHRYRVNNLGQRDLAVSVHFWVPVLLNSVAVWDVALEAPAQSLPCVSEREPPRHPDFLTHILGSSVLDCSIAGCLRFRCDVPSFGIQEELDFILKGNLSFGWVSQTLRKKVLVVSVAEITFDRSAYSQLPGQEAFMRAQMETVLEEYEVYNPIPLMAGSSVGGLLLLALITAALYKLGFFKRQYKEMLGDKPEDAATFSGEDFSCEASNLPLS